VKNKVEKKQDRGGVGTVKKNFDIGEKQSVSYNTQIP